VSSGDEQLRRLLEKKYERMVQEMQRKSEHREMIEVTDASFSDVISAGKPALLDFWAAWCAPCRIMHPILEKLHAKYGDRVIFGRLDVDRNPNTAAQYSVFSIPTFILFKGGSPVERLVGAVGAGPLESAIRKHTPA